MEIDPFDISTYPNFYRLKESFFKYLTKDYKEEFKNNLCSFWQGAKSGDGYGIITWGGKCYATHRVSYLIFNGTIPYNKLVRHTCDNPLCINHKHLILGTVSDNGIDSVKRQRHGQQKLTKQEVIKIKIALKKPYYGIVSALARKYNINSGAISSIRKGHSWTWVTI